MKEYDHKKIEKKWQTFWEKKGIYHAKDFSKKPKYYSLVEFPYPSGVGLHIGHPRSYTGMDIVSRKRRMEGYNVLYPIGWDAFGLPTENYAIKTGKDPRVVTKKNTDTFRRQLKSIGFSFDWSREINTTDPKYYKWTQWIFLQFLKKGLAYKAKININWCPKDKIGLANEEVVAGCCERCGTPVEKREKEQWMLAITKYAQRLDKDLDDVDYLPQIKLAQRNWIGKSEGAEIEFKIQYNPSLTLPEGEGEMPRFFTTNPELWRVLQDKALEMRKNPTNGEKTMWNLLRKNSFSPAIPGGEGENSKGFHFRRQHIINRFIVDFVCIEKKLVIEVDGDIHDYKKSEDQERTKILNQLGFEVIRFTNSEVIKNKESVLKKISLKLNSVSSKALSFGEGLGGVKVFTTRPDTIFGATYLVLAPEHELVQSLKSKINNWGEVEKYIKEVKNKTDIERTAEDKIKTGVELKGIKAINPANKEEIAVWIADYVLPHYGTGAIMAVPAHDERDFEFAKKYGLEIKQVVSRVVHPTEYPIKEGTPFVNRDAVMCIVKHWEKDEYLCQEWKDFSEVRTLISGGIEPGEDIVSAGVREIKEESGYLNPKFIKQLGGFSYVEFYHKRKKENRRARFRYLYFELQDGEKIDVSEEEDNQHRIVWKKPEEVVNFLNIGEKERIWELFSGKKEEVFTGIGYLVNSNQFDGSDSEKVKKEIIKFVGGKEKTTFKLRDWVFSRQRYWGEPIPVINCGKCGLVSVPEKDLPVMLPKVKNYQPTDSGESPLANISKWVNVKCPKCKGKAKRETDTMPNWAGSSWYYLRYTDPKNKKEFAGKKNLKYWLGSPKQGEGGTGGVDWYNGGNEHTTLHLLYSRFWHKFLYDLKLVPTSEPYKKRTSHGMILGEGGMKMSKSLGNVINPDDIVKTYGADTLRVYEMFMGPFSQSVAWSTESIIGSRRFIERVWNLQSKVQKNKKYTEFEIEKTIKKVSEGIEEMKFNTAISTLMIFVNEISKLEFISKIAYEKFLKILSPFSPHITEEVWFNLGNKNSIHLSEWPKWDPNLIKDEEIKIAVQINGKVRTEMMIKADEKEETIKQKALKNEIVLKYISGQNIKKVIYVKNRLINIVL
jgi:leucyl-tRNA synthetase